MIELRAVRVEQFKTLASVDLRFPRQGAVPVEGLN